MPIRPISSSDKAQIEEAAGFAANLATKILTFDDTAAGAPDLFTVTGDVIVRVIAVVKTTVLSGAGANGEVGIAGETLTTKIITRTILTRLVEGEIWHGTTPELEIEPLSEMSDWIISNGNDIIFTLDAQADSGSIAFYCLWTALSADGMVVAA